MKLNFKKFDFKKGRSLLSFGLSPHRDWKIILSTCIILSLLLLSFSFLVWKKASGVKVTESSQEELMKLNTLNVELLRRTVLYYEEKANTLEEIKSKRSIISDPSL